MQRSYTKEIEQILKARKNVGFMNQIKQMMGPCNCGSQSIFVKSRERLVKSVHTITDVRWRQTVAVKGLISCLLRHEHLLNILILGCRIGLNLILYSLLANLQFFLSHSRVTALR